MTWPFFFVYKTFLNEHCLVMNITLEYSIVNVRTLARKPGFVYATIVDKRGQLCVNATLDYCVEWLEMALERAKTEATKTLAEKA